MCACKCANTPVLIHSLTIAKAESWAYTFQNIIHGFTSHFEGSDTSFLFDPTKLMLYGSDSI